MRILGIDFVPLNTPLRSHLEVLSAGTMFFLILGLLPVGYILSIYMLFYSKYWFPFCIYLIWIWVFDRDAADTGGRPSEWVRSWSVFEYAKSYFPVQIKAEPGFALDPRRNYVSCTFPHGAMPLGSVATTFTKENKLFCPHHFMHGLTLKSNFFVPLYREFLLSIGFCSVTPRSINSILSTPGGGHVAGLIVGGAAESLHCKPGEYKLVLNNRKGFVKLAIKNGAPIIPQFAFGQNDSFKQLMFPENSILRRIQYLVKRITGIAPIMFYGRGLFQYNFGMIPIQKPITIVMGHPIEVQKIDNPTQEEIDNVHKLFIQRLTEIYEAYKYEFAENPEESKLIII